MISYKELKDIYNDIKNDKIMMWTFRILLIIFVVVFAFASILYFKDGANGKHSKLLWGLAERNIPKGYPDTVYSTVLIHDTIYSAITNPGSLKTQPFNSHLIKTPQKKIDQKNVSGKNEANEVAGDNFGNVGGSGNTVNNDLMVKQRHLNSITTNYIISTLPKKKSAFIQLIYNGDKESNNYLNEIYQLLIKNGYTIIRGGVLAGGFDCYDNIKVTLDSDSTGANIVICPASNVKD